MLASRGNTRHKTVAGAAWEADGGFTIRINPGVVITDSDKYFIGLWERDRDTSNVPPPPETDEDPPPPDDPDFPPFNIPPAEKGSLSFKKDDDIPEDW